ncbi:histidinol-phosphate transaminase [Paenibacillus turpanensis]|uniref:histidinol-phosphate transaminase n=1 Tax=Paenibacillus turpanensis TaxID=2689078 RepID=UPI00140BF53F|nr:histidinol-phosphate transaminase [Paenibacillus turpanensis]
MSPIQVSARTVLQALQPYSPGKPIWEVQKELGLTEVIKLASNENPLGPSPKALEAISALLPALHQYPDAQSFAAKAAIASEFGILPEQIIVTNGGDELITLVSEAFLDHGDEIIVPSPTFSEYEFGGRLMGANVKTIPLAEGYRYDPEAILAAVTERTKIVYLCSPNNPTGTILETGPLKRLLDSLPQHVLVMLDSAYSHYVTCDDYTDGLELIRSGYPLLMLKTFSKVYGLAGIRVGFGIGPQEIIQSILQVKEPFNVNALAQAAAAAAIRDREHVERSRSLVHAERLRLYEAYRKLGLEYTESMSNFILVRLGPDAKQRYEQLMQKGVIVRYGGAWGLSECVRISVGSPEENDKLIHALEEVVQGK